MSFHRSSLMFLGAAFFLIGYVSARPANDSDKATDVHLNSVLPEKERGAVRLVESVNNAEPTQHISDSSANLEMMSEDKESQSTTDDGITVVTERPSYFSRLIQSIFDIPISVLQSVRNLINTSYRSPPRSNNHN